MDFDNRYWIQGVNLTDLDKSIRVGDLVAIVDEDAGGIVAYILDPFVEKIVNDLNMVDRVKKTVCQKARFT